MVLEDLIVGVADDDGRATIISPEASFMRSADSAWVSGDMPSPVELMETFTSVTNPDEVKALIRELLNSSCEIPNRERAAFQALL